METWFQAEDVESSLEAGGGSSRKSRLNQVSSISSSSSNGSGIGLPLTTMIFMMVAGTNTRLGKWDGVG